MEEPDGIWKRKLGEVLRSQIYLMGTMSYALKAFDVLPPDQRSAAWFLAELERQISAQSESAHSPEDVENCQQLVEVLKRILSPADS